MSLFTDILKVGHYGGGLHLADVPDENLIPFSKVSQANFKKCYGN
jgi:hypothetical protein